MGGIDKNYVDTKVASEASTRNTAIQTSEQTVKVYADGVVFNEAQAWIQIISTAIQAEVQNRSTTIAEVELRMNIYTDNAVQTEQGARNITIGKAIAAEVIARNQAITDVQMSLQKFLDPVETYTDLPDPSTFAPSMNYLWKVMNNPQKENNVIWQFIACESAWYIYERSGDFATQQDVDTKVASEVAVSTNAINSVITTE